jgi:hypothetical protein
MSREQEPNARMLSSIHIDLGERSITFTILDELATKLTFTPRGVLYQLLGGASMLESATAEAPVAAEIEATPVDAPKEKEPTTVISGRLKSTPKLGEADRSGNPTAWARLAAHAEGEQEAHMYSATFHRHTAKIAQTLQAGAQVTVEGYPHPSKREGRMDTFSVINLLRYPGKPERGSS